MTDKENKKKNPGISLVVQWLGLCFHCQGPWDLGELKSYKPCHVAGKKEKKITFDCPQSPTQK